jgi:hypothetical protein
LRGGQPPKGGSVPCKRCSVLFYRKVGRNYYCNACRRLARKEYSKQYGRTYYLKNVNRIKEKTTRYQKANPELKRKWSREFMARKARFVTTQVFAHYSGGTWQCACCGESEREFLTIDHTSEGGSRMNRELGIPRGGMPLYSWLFKNNYPLGFELVCMNCNLSRAKHRGVCVH